MQRMSAHEAKSRFGRLIDEARRQPVTIEKHGRAVAVMISKEAYDEMEVLKLEKLKAEVAKGIAAIERGDYSEVSLEQMDDYMAEIRNRAEKARESE